MNRTIEQYLQELPNTDGVRDKALKNMYKEYAGEWSTSLLAALERAFLFHQSPEGFQYWRDICDDIKSVDKIPNVFTTNTYYR